MTHPHLHPQTPEQAQPKPQNDGAVSQSQLWTIVIVTALVAVFMAVGITLLVINTSSNTPQASETQPSAAEIPAQQEEETDTNTTTNQSATPADNRILYTKQASQSDILSYNTRTQEVQTWVEHPGDQTQFFDPQFLDHQSISFVRCTYGSVESQIQEDQFCGIYKKSPTAEKEILKVLPNVTESNDVEERYIKVFDWNATGDIVSYVTDEYDLETNRSQFHIFVYDTETNKSKRIDTHGPIAGRGGSAADEIDIHFSPDDSKILVTLTSLYPSQPDTDQGTLFVYDAQEQTQLWKEPQNWTTYGRWLTNDTFIARQTATDTQDQQPTIITVNPVTQTKTIITDEIDAYYIEVRDENTIVYWRNESREGDGVTMELFDLNTKTATILQKQAIPLFVSTREKEAILYWTMQPCESTANANQSLICSAGIFNGTKPNLLQEYGIELDYSNELSPQFTYDDIRVADFW